MGSPTKQTESIRAAKRAKRVTKRHKEGRNKLRKNVASTLHGILAAK